MSYTAWCDQLETEFFDSAAQNESLLLTSATITQRIGEAPEFDFTVPPSNVIYDNLAESVTGSDYSLASCVVVYQDDALIFLGRVYSVKLNFNLTIDVQCEGLFATLNDSVYKAPDGGFTGTLEDFLQALIDNHNTQSDYQFKLGTIDSTLTELVELAGSEITYDSTDYATTKSILDDLISEYGGYMDASTDYSLSDFITIYTTGYVTTTINWVYTYDSDDYDCAQAINFGQNLLDITQARDISSVVNCLIPYGAEVDGTRVDLSSMYKTDSTLSTIMTVLLGINCTEDIDGNSVYYLQNTSSVSKYGKIWGTCTWDTDDAETLWVLASTYLSVKCSGSLEIDISAVDLSSIGQSSDGFFAGKRVHILSDRHGIDDDYVVAEANIDLLDPSGSTYTLGNESALSSLLDALYNIYSSNSSSYSLSSSSSSSSSDHDCWTEDEIKEVVEDWFYDNIINCETEEY